MADELCEYFKQRYPEHFICGYEDCNVLLWGWSEGGNTPVRCCTMNVGIDYDPLSVSKKEIINELNRRYLEEREFYNLYHYGKGVAEAGGFPFLVIAYPALRREYGGRWEESKRRYPTDDVKFYVRESARASYILTGRELKAYLYERMGCDFPDEGTGKEKNKRLGDYFHFWSREKLSSRLTKLDVDGCFYDSSDSRILIEIKRSGRPPIPNWRPYPADKPDYLMQQVFASRGKARFWVLHHEPGAPCHGGTRISFFDVKDVDMSRDRSFLICSEQRIPMTLDQLDEKLKGVLKMGGGSVIQA